MAGPTRPLIVRTVVYDPIEMARRGRIGGRVAAARDPEHTRLRRAREALRRKREEQLTERTAQAPAEVA